MRKFLPVIAALVAAVSAVPSQAGADDASATILLPTPFVGTGQSGAIGTFDCTTPDATCDKGTFSGLHRRLYINAPDVAQSDTMGVVGYTIPITRRNVAFTLRSQPPNTADFDITFYKSLGTPPNGPADTDFGTARSLFSRFGNQAETGTVPAGATFAIITLWGGANAVFDYSS